MGFYTDEWDDVFFPVVYVREDGVLERQLEPFTARAQRKSSFLLGDKQFRILSCFLFHPWLLFSFLPPLVWGGRRANERNGVKSSSNCSAQFVSLEFFGGG